MSGMKLIMLPGDGLIVGHVADRHHALDVVKRALDKGVHVHGAWLWGKSSWADVHRYNERPPRGAEVLAGSDLPMPVRPVVGDGTVYMVWHCEEKPPHLMGIFSSPVSADKARRRAIADWKRRQLVGTPHIDVIKTRLDRQLDTVGTGNADSDVVFIDV